MGKKQFKAESKRLLDLMINSIYTNKDIFLRELISNASDAIDKKYFKDAQAGKTGLSREDYYIRIERDDKNRTITIRDNGIGMTEKELEDNLGIIAKSGTLAFKKENEGKLDEAEIIGQFGVGFYSAFMVSSNIKVISLADGAERAYIWESDGTSGYTVEPCEKEDGVGTTVILKLRGNSSDESFDEYLTEFKIRELVRKYSDYIRYPIVMEVTKTREKEATEEEKATEGYEPEYEEYQDDLRLNTMIPLWKKKKSEITEAEYTAFYMNKFFDWKEPLKVIHTNVEGLLSYDSLLFIPQELPFNYYSQDYKQGLQLYSSGVMIMDSCEELLPEYFGFVKGLVDSQDLSLNISRELLQHDRQLKAIAQRLEKKISETLTEMQTKEREKYDKLFSAFGLQIKYGIYDNYGINKDKLVDLIMFRSSTTEALATFKEYVERMPEGQKYIYYASGESPEKLANMPQMDPFKDKGYEVLFLTDEIDEFVIKILASYDEKYFKSISDKDLGFEITDEEKEVAEAKNAAAKDILDAVKEALGDDVASVIISTRLKNHPVCFASGEGLSIEMEKILTARADAMGETTDGLKADKILELNDGHSFFAALTEAVESGNKEKVEDYSRLLYDQALIIEGMPVPDPIEFSNRISKLMV